MLASRVLLVFGAARASGTQLSRASPHFFVLGSAFMLLETRSIVTFSLLFGNTWIVNALAFFAILASVLLSILVNAFVRVRRPGLLYAALLAALAVELRPPPRVAPPRSAGSATSSPSALAFAPVFLANLVFTHSFRDTKTADTGVRVEPPRRHLRRGARYLSLAIGFRALLVVAAVLYALAYVLAGAAPAARDKELVTATRVISASSRTRRRLRSAARSAPALWRRRSNVGLEERGGTGVGCPSGSIATMVT